MEEYKETALTLKFRGIESQLLEELVQRGFFSSKSEAIRAALVDYFLKLGLLTREQQWKEIQALPKRKVSPEQLQKDLEKIENEVE